MRAEVARDPRAQTALGLLAERNDLRVLLDGGRQLFHRAVDLKFHRVIDEQHAAVIRDIGQNGGILLPRALRLLEQVDVVHAHERPLGHHGHGVDRVSQRLRRAVVGGKAVEVKLARRAVGEFFRGKLHIMAAQKRFLAADDIKAAERSGLQIRFEAALSLGSGVVRLFFCHLLTP